MKVLLLSKYSRKGASSRLRSMQFIPWLSDQAVDVAVHSLFDDSYLEVLYGDGRRSTWRVIQCYLRRLNVLRSAGRYDVLWIEYELFPYLPAWAERLLRSLGVRYVVDYDDAIFHNYDLHSRSLVRWLLGTKIDVVMRNASCVVAGNDYLAERACDAGASQVIKIPTVVDSARYEPSAPDEQKQLVVGWIGSPSTQRYVLDIEQALRSAAAKFDLRLMLVGATDSVVHRLDGINVEVVPWSESTEADCVRAMDVGIMPLPDGPWERGKCGYKLIQYMACAVPVIASPVGVNVQIVGQSSCGLLANSDAEWSQALLQLLSSAEKRRAFGQAGRRAVEQTYSLQAQAPRLLSLFGALADKERR